MRYPPEVSGFFSKNKNHYYNFLKKTNQKEVASRYISIKLNKANEKRKIRVLCVGGGNGEADLKIIRKIKNRPVLIDYVDPSMEMQKDFIKRAKNIKGGKKLCDIKTDRFELDSCKPKKQDLILCLNSVYFLDGWRKPGKKNPLLKIYGTLKDGGVAIIGLKSHESDHTRIKEAAGGGTTTGNKVREVLRKLKIPYYYETVPAEMDISSLYAGNRFSPSEEGNMLLSFLFKGQWEKFDGRKKERVISEIKNRTKNINGKKVIVSKYEYIWVYKPIKKNPSLPGGHTASAKEKSLLEKELRKNLRIVPDFPVEGIKFIDTTRLLRNKRLFKRVIKYAADFYKKDNVDYCIAKDMQGLIWAGAIANELNCGVIPMFRKDLAGDIISTTYSHEYNPDRVINLQKESIRPGEKALLVDYIIATGETMNNMTKLLEHLGADVVGIFSVIELGYLNGKKKLDQYNVNTLIRYDD